MQHTGYIFTLIQGFKISAAPRKQLQFGLQVGVLFSHHVEYYE